MHVFHSSMFASLVVSAALLCTVGDARHTDDSIQGAGHELVQKPSPLGATPEQRAPTLGQLPAMVGLSSSAVVEMMAVLAAVVVLGFVCYRFLVEPAASSREPSPRGTYLRQPSMLASSVLVITSDNEDTVDTRNEDYFEEDAYSLAIALVIRDTHRIATGNCNKRLRLSRLFFSLGLIILTVGIQVSILMCTKAVVTPQSVAKIRDAYDQYEQAMYGEHVSINQNGKHRGLNGFFNASAFDALDDDLKSDVCNIPLSQLGFISLVLLVWAITCMAQLKKGAENFMAVVVFSSTIDSMKDAITEAGEEDSGPGGDDDGAIDENGVDDGLPVYVISGCTLAVKVFLSIFVFLPDIATTCYILWLGSRWLVATNDFGNVVSNAVALEFTLMLKCLLFYALVSERNKRDLSHTALAPSWHQEPAGYAVYYSSTIWAVLAVLWVYYYVHHQAVLPEYKWDVHSVCTSWLQNQLNPDSGN